ncbi:hypothetical protein ACFE04_028314 [Oxalis oulophora]
MDVIDYLKPRFVLMENVVDLYRLRFLVWGARPSETLPPFPLPRHDVIKRVHAPVHFKMNVVDFEEGQWLELRQRLYLEDAIFDLPPVRVSLISSEKGCKSSRKGAICGALLISSKKGCNILAKWCNMWCTSNILVERMQYPRERVRVLLIKSACFPNILGERVQSSRKGACFTNILGERVRVSEGACFERVQYPRERRKDAISSRKGAICGALLISSKKGCNILAKGGCVFRKDAISSRKGACFTNILGEMVQYPRKRVHVSLISSDFACNMGCTSNILGERMQYPRKRVRVSLISSEKGFNILAKECGAISSRKGACFTNILGERVQYPRERVHVSLISSEKGCVVFQRVRVSEI